MARLKKMHGFDVYTIVASDGITTATFVPERGGVAASITLPHDKKEREILFQHDNFWQKNNTDLPGGLPLIFPICARIERQGVAGDYLYDGKLYNLPIHGFAASSVWHVIDATRSDAIVLALNDTALTHERYPFNFKIELEYQVLPGQIICKQRYSNTGNRDLPYYAGFHPYFLTPEVGKGKEQVLLDFNPTRRFRYNKKLTDLVGEQELLTLPIAVTDPRINEQLHAIKHEKKVSLTFPDGFKLNLRADGVEDEQLFSYLQIYTEPAKPFVCLEPWMAFPNALNSVCGVRWLKPGCSESGILTLWGG